MKKTKFSGRHLSFLVAAFAMVASMAVPLTTAFAAQATERSVTVSSASMATTGVQYDVKFTTSSSAAASMVVYFCGNSPMIGQSCVAPSGFSAAAATVETSGFTLADAPSANRVQVNGAYAANTPIEVSLAGLVNPSTAAPMYVRVVTYDTTTSATNATDVAPNSGMVDEGSMAVAITPTVGVSGVVLETLTFCVSGGTDADPSVSPIEAGCTGTLTAPTLTLGETAGDVTSLVAGVLSQGSIFTQISTNASGGAVVRLKSTATNCGGLLRAGAPDQCDIQPAGATDIDPEANEAKFGVKTALATDGTGANGSYAPVVGSVYNNDSFALNFVIGNEQGVTSPFGDPFLDTASAPANNKNMALTFGATVANNTPAGTYSTDLSLIAVGKF